MHLQGTFETMDEWLWDHEIATDPLQKDSLNRNKQKFENYVQRILSILREDQDRIPKVW